MSAPELPDLIEWLDQEQEAATSQLVALVDRRSAVRDLVAIARQVRVRLGVEQLSPRELLEHLEDDDLEHANALSLIGRIQRDDRTEDADE